MGSIPIFSMSTRDHSGTSWCFNSGIGFVEEFAGTMVPDFVEELAGIEASAVFVSPVLSKSKFRSKTWTGVCKLLEAGILSLDGCKPKVESSTRYKCFISGNTNSYNVQTPESLEQAF